MCLLELITGEKPHTKDLRLLVKSNLSLEALPSVIDERIQMSMDVASALQVAKLALWCLAHESDERASVADDALPALEKELECPTVWRAISSRQ
jgi:hypothetical protein